MKRRAERTIFSVFLVFFVLVFMGCVNSVSALTITLDPLSKITAFAANDAASSGTTANTISTSLPGSGSVNAIQGTIPSGTYTDTTASYNFTTSGADQASFNVSSNLAIATATAFDWSVTEHHTFFNIDANALYDLSGTFNASGLVGGKFQIYLKNIDTATMVFDTSLINTFAFAQSSVTGTLVSGNYEYYMESWLDSRTPTISSIPVSTGTGDSTLLITAVPEPTTIALLGIGLVGLAGAAVRRRLKKAKQ